MKNDKFAQEFIEEILEKKFSDYYEKSNLLFDFIQGIEDRNRLKKSFEIFRDNYFFRTLNTIPCVSKVIIAAARAGDFETLAEVGQNLYEETGEGRLEKVHSFLLEQSHNLHGAKVFDLPQTTLQNAQQSKLLIEEAYILEELQNEKYGSSKYHVVLAISYAQETVATHMLSSILESFFVPFINDYSFMEFEYITRYFTCHITGLEQRHSDDAKQALYRACKSQIDWKESLDTISLFLEIQSNFWLGLRKKMELNQTLSIA